MLPSGSPPITPDLLSLIAEIEEFKGAWRALGRMEPERLRQLRRVATIESVGSSTRIEGARLTDREVEALLANPASHCLASRDEQEVAGYAEAMDAVLAGHDSMAITESLIKRLHSMLLRYSEKDGRHRGEYKRVANRIEAFNAEGQSLGVIFETASPFDTPRLMAELVAWHKRVAADKSIHPLLAAGVFTVALLAIHPFQDGNGRLSRVLTTLMLLRAGYAYAPYSSLERIVEATRDEYYLALRRTQTTIRDASPDWTPWLTYFLRTMQQQKARLEATVERERLMRTALPELSITILDLVAAHGQVSVGELMRATATPRSTVKKRVAELVAAGYLKPVGRSRGTKYAVG